MKYKTFYVETGTKELTDAVCKHGESLGYKRMRVDRESTGNVFFYSGGDYQNYNCKHTEEKLSIKDFFKLTKEDVIMSKPEVKTDRLHRLDEFFTKLLAGEVEIEDRSEGLCNLLNEYCLCASEVFEVIEVTKWDKFSDRVDFPVPLYNVNPETAYKTHEDLWDKKHPYGRNRWKFVEWCHEQIKAQIEKSVKEDVEFPVLVEGKTNGAVVLYTGETSGVFCDSDDPVASVGEYRTDLKPFHKHKEIRILKTAKELGLQVRGEK